MNRAILMGRLTRDPELRQTGNGLSVCSFTVAVNRRFKNANGERVADFIPCVAWRQQADLLARYFHKGQRILVSGTLYSNSWTDKEGNKRSRIELMVDEIDFVESSNSSYSGSSNDNYRRTNDDFSMGSQKESYSSQENKKEDLVDEPSFGSGDSFFDDMDDDSTELPFDL